MIKKNIICILLSINIFFISCFCINRFDRNYNVNAAVSTGVVVGVVAVSSLLGFFAYNFLNKTQAIAPSETLEEWARKKANVDLVSNLAKVNAIYDVISNKKVNNNVVEFSPSDLQIINSNLKSEFGDIVTGNNLKHIPDDMFSVGNVQNFIRFSELANNAYADSKSKIRVYIEPTSEFLFANPSDSSFKLDAHNSYLPVKDVGDPSFSKSFRKLNVGVVLSGTIDSTQIISIYVSSDGMYYNTGRLSYDYGFTKLTGRNGALTNLGIANASTFTFLNAYTNTSFISDYLNLLTYRGNSVLTWENTFQGIVKSDYSKILDNTNSISTPSKLELELDNIKSSSENISVSLDNIGADTKKGVGILGSILDAIGSFFGSIGKWLEKVWEKLTSLDIISSILNALLSALQWVKDFLSTMVDGIVTGIKNLFKWAFDISDVHLVDFPHIAWLTAIFMFVINICRLLLTYTPNSPVFSITLPWWGKEKIINFKVDDFFNKLNYKGLTSLEIIRYLNDFALCILIGFRFTRLINGGDN